MPKYFTKTIRLDKNGRAFISQSIRQNLGLEVKDILNVEVDIENSRIIISKSSIQNLPSKSSV